VTRRFPLAALLLATPAAAQTGVTCRPGDDSNEARTLATMAVAMAFTPAEAPALPTPWRVELGLELATVPEVDSADAVPTTCRPGKGAENVNLLDVLPRPRVRIGLPGGLAVEGSWIPPVRVHGVQANVLGLALARPMAILGRRAVLSPRAHATVGRVRAPVTCPEAALDDPASECFGGTTSDDRWDPGQLGVDVAVAWGGGRLRPYLGAGWTHLEPTFQVNFTNAAGQLDDTRVRVSLDRVALFAGLTWAAGSRIALSGEAYAVPADAATLRLAGRYALSPPPRAAPRLD
jgi:hypothetical protein